MPDNRAGMHPGEGEDNTSPYTSENRKTETADAVGADDTDMTGSYDIGEEDAEDPEKGELLRYLQKRTENRKRREKQVRTLWFILAVTVLLSVLTIVYVGTRLAGRYDTGSGNSALTGNTVSGSTSGQKVNAVSAGSSAVSEDGEASDSSRAESEVSEASDSSRAESEVSEVTDSSRAESEVSEVTDSSAADSGAGEVSDGSTDDSEAHALSGSSAGPGTDAAPKEPSESGEDGTAAGSSGSGEGEVTFVAAGDNLIHQRLYEQAAARSGGSSYDFAYAYDMAAPFITQHDIAWIDVETLINNRFEPSGYPDFSTPGENGNALLEAGFNVFSLASNHTYDFGAEGVEATLDYWDETLPDGAVTTGLWEGDRYEDIPILTTEQGYRIAFLTYVDFMNGAPEEEMPGRVILLAEEDLIRDQIRLAREQADAVIVSCHWGEEGSHDITEDQMLMSQKVADWGADIIIGDHTHVIQNAAWITAADGRRVFCVYSLGNFVSTQELPDELIGQLFEVTLRFMDGPDGKIVEVANPKLVPILTVYGEDGTESRTALYRDVTNEDIREHGIRTAFPEFTRTYIEKVIRDNVNGQFLEEPLAEFTDDGEEEAEEATASSEETEQTEKETGSPEEAGETEKEAGTSENAEDTEKEEEASENTEDTEGRTEKAVRIEKTGKPLPGTEPEETAAA